MKFNTYLINFYSAHKGIMKLQKNRGKMPFYNRTFHNDSECLYWMMWKDHFTRGEKVPSILRVARISCSCTSSAGVNELSFQTRQILSQEKPPR